MSGEVREAEQQMAFSFPENLLAVYFFPSHRKAAEASHRIAQAGDRLKDGGVPLGFSYRRRVYRAGKLIAYYAGEERAVYEALEKICGKPFAGIGVRKETERVMAGWKGGGRYDEPVSAVPVAPCGTGDEPPGHGEDALGGGGGLFRDCLPGGGDCLDLAGDGGGAVFFHLRPQATGWPGICWNRMKRLPRRPPGIRMGNWRRFQRPNGGR